ncbi:RNA-directed DNA polymerase [Nonomuraea sp. NPDC048901]|uniref:RNA-directed DNA polymerase n=1 Tax=Nonomuraea sp. NPDC048901 TaxID=3155627 RepID=UPI0033D6671F
MANLGLDLQKGASLARQEMYGDWYRDPWGWPELTVVDASTLDAERDLHLRRGAAGEFHLQHRPFFHLIEVPKTHLGVRPAVIQDPMSRLAYLSSALTGLSGFHGALPDWVYGWRTRDSSAMATNSSEWAAYVETLPRYEQQGFGLQTDITSFFASIRPDRLEQLIYDKLGKVAAASVIMDVIRAHDSLSTRSGLPQRSFASAILAHVVLQPIDDALAAGAMDEGITAVRRWMDDISAEGDEDALFSLLFDLQERAREIGLELNASKTRLAPVGETALNLQLEHLKEIELPLAVAPGQGYSSEDEGEEESGFEPDMDTLLMLERSILAAPRNAHRTIAKAVLVSLTKLGEFSRHTEWRQTAPSLPHVADSLGRYLRRASEDNESVRNDLGDWFKTYESSPWGRLAWVSSQYALAFPAAHVPPAVHEVLRAWITTSTNIQQVAIAVQRICSSSPALGRNLIRARVDRTADPLLLRIFALGLLMAGESRGAVEAVLGRDPRNELLTTFLANRRWEEPPVVKDFDLSVDWEDEQGGPA